MWLRLPKAQFCLSNLFNKLCFPKLSKRPTTHLKHLQFFRCMGGTNCLPPGDASARLPAYTMYDYKPVIRGIQFSIFFIHNILIWVLFPQVRANVSSNHTPTFEVHDLDSRSSYTLILYAANAKGRSEEVTLYTVAIRPPDKYTGKFWRRLVALMYCYYLTEKSSTS